MRDADTSIAVLRDVVRRFVDERDWQQFHTPKNLSMALAIEAAELMEHFQWLTPEQSSEVADDPARRAAAGEELADVFCYVIALADELKLDLAAAFEDKMAKNVRKYPAEEYRGRYGPEDPGPADA